MVELVRAGRDPESLAREFEPSSQALRNWVAVADRQEGRRDPRSAPAPKDEALTTPEREELARFRREVRQLRVERDILSRAAQPGNARWGPRERALYRRHRGLVEGIHAAAQTWHGLARPIRRGLANMQIQAFITTTVINLKRLAEAVLLALFAALAMTAQPVGYDPCRRTALTA